MKTIKIIITAIAAVFMISCGTYYRMVTTLDRDGNVLREVYANGDSAFMAGNMSNNPYLFDIVPDWNITRFDSAVRYNFFGDEKNLNVKVSKNASSINLLSKELTFSQNNRSFAAPEETLTKKFRWFYTNYVFTGVFKKLNYNVPIPIEKYLSEEEQKLWSQGYFSNYREMNGAEMNEMLGGIEGKFIEWYSRNCFEISLHCIEKLSNEKIADIDKEKIYRQLNEQEQGADIMPERVCKTLDAYYKTTRYTEFYKLNEKKVDQEYGNAMAVENQLMNTISYELVVPGEILSANSPIVNSNILTWKVDGIRILLDDYILTAEYRVANFWVFIISGMILITAIASIILLFRRKRSI